MASLRLVALVALALLYAGACTSILGDEFEVADTATAAGTGNVGGSAGAGATGGSTTTAGGGSGGGTPTGTGAGGGGGCVLGTGDGCGPDFKCSVVDVNTGAIGCVGAGSRPAWSLCASDSQCETGTWCDLIVGVCRPLCVSTTCANNGTCLPAENGTTNIPGLFVCTSNCEPDQATPCVQDYGNVTCARTADDWDCVPSGNADTGDTCGSDHDCLPGLICTSSGYCWEWCQVGQNATCTTGTGPYCASVSPPAMHDNGEYGTCIIT